MIARVEKVLSGRTLTIESGRVARQANGAVVVRFADTEVFAAVTAAKPRPDIDFFPLSVDYREKTSAAGKFPGGFIKREGRPTTKEILTARLIDRPLRPLFPDGYEMDTSVQSLVLAADRQNDPDILAMIAASAALAVSDIPFLGPLGAVRVGLIEGRLVIYPTAAELKLSDLDLVVAGTRDAVTMVECGAREVSESTMIEAIGAAHEVIREIVELQEMLIRQCGKAKMRVELAQEPEVLKGELRRRYYHRFAPALRTDGKMARKKAVQVVVDSAIAEVCPAVASAAANAGDQPCPDQVKSILVKLSEEAEREMILVGTRSDGRQHADIRAITAEVGMLPPIVHGSSLFTRGETQALVSVTLGTGGDQQIVDGLGEEYSERFMLHYNFPSFSVGETWPNRGPKRREIGHGALAQRALLAVMPAEEDFPYTIRVTSDVMESNGSSSMATVCGGTLALMDAGVKIRQPVAGIAMGLVKDGDRIAILSDILGSEDHNGDMDFKVAGTQFGITALQMDIKTTGLSLDIMTTALEQARVGRIHVLKEMLKALQKPRDEISPHAPKIIQMRIDPEKIGLVIGPGGKMIKKIQEETDTTIEIEDDGKVTIWGESTSGAQRAQERIEAITEEVRAGRVYQGRVVSIKEFGCFVEVLPGQEGLVHVSELATGYVEKVSDVVSIGDIIPVKCLGTDNQGRIRLSKSAAETDDSGEAGPAPARAMPRPGGPGAGGGGAGGVGGGGGGGGGGGHRRRRR